MQTSLVNKNLKALYIAGLLAATLLFLSLAPPQSKAQELSENALIYYRILDGVIKTTATDQIRQLKKNLPCFKGQFEHDATNYINKFAASDDTKNRITNILKRSFSGEELITIAKYYNTSEGGMVLQKFAKSINNKNDDIWTNHDFFSTPLGQKIVSTYPATKRNFMIEGGATLFQHLLKNGDLFLKHVTLDGKCR